MKKLIILCNILFLNLNINAQATNYLWAKSAGGTSNDYSNDVTSDAFGNVFVAGSFYSHTITFGNITLTNEDNTGTTTDIFIVKYDPSGNVLWAKNGGGAMNDFGQFITTDAAGNVLITGGFQSNTITFGNVTLTNANTISSNSNIFIVKYDASGNVLWGHSAGGAYDDIESSISVDATGDVLLTGVFKSESIIFGSYSLTNSNFSGTSGNIFIVKFDAAGNVLWAKAPVGSSDDVIASVFLDAFGNFLLTGGFNGNIVFGNITLTSSYGQNFFVVKYDAWGNVLWAKDAIGASAYGNSISTDNSGNVLITGYYQTPNITFEATTLTNADTSEFGYNSGDIFIVKYDSSGNVLWANSAGGIYYDLCNSASIDSQGNIFIAGFFYSPTITFGANTLTNAGCGQSDIFIAKYDASGNLIWANSAGNCGGERGQSIFTDAFGNVLVIGSFSSNSITFENNTLMNSGGSDIFIVKYDASGNVIWAQAVGGTQIDNVQNVSTDASGNILLTGVFESSAISFGSSTLINNTNNTYNFTDLFIVKLSGGVTGMEENSKQSTVLIYPNPSNGQFVVQKLENAANAIEIYNSLGEVIYKSIFIKSSSAIDLSNQPKGIYLIKIISENKTIFNKKIIIQ